MGFAPHRSLSPSRVSGAGQGVPARCHRIPVPFPAGGGGRSRGGFQGPVWTGRPAPFRSWDAARYRPWQEGRALQSDCWRGERGDIRTRGQTAAALLPEPLSPCLTGGDVTFDISNDAPTMAGAKATFSIALRFPSTQTVLPDGRVVWSQNCTVNGGHGRGHRRGLGRGLSNASLTACSLQAPAWCRGTRCFRSCWPRARMVSSPTGSPFPAAPGTNVGDSSTSGGRGVRTALRCAPSTAGMSPCLTAVCLTAVSPQGVTGRWWTERCRS